MGGFMDLINTPSQKNKEFFENLYFSAFPEDERIDTSDLYELYNQGFIEIDLINHNNKNIGFAVIYLNENIHLLSYFAIDPALRGMGYGSKSLKLLKEKYDDLMIEIESTKFKDADDYSLRNRRKAFYIRNGFKILDAEVDYFGIEMELMATTKDAGIDEYMQTYLNIFDDDFVNDNIKLLDM